MTNNFNNNMMKDLTKVNNILKPINITENPKVGGEQKSNPFIKPLKTPRNAKHEMGRQELVRKVIQDGKEFKANTKNNQIGMDNKIQGNFHN